MAADIRLLDMLVIGAGPIGLNCGIRCVESGLSHVILDRGVLVNSIYNYPLNMTFFSTSERLEIGNVPFISHSPKPTRSEALEYYRRVALHWRLDVRLYEEVLSVELTANGFRTITSRGVWHSKAVVIATGFYDIPNLMQVSGEQCTIIIASPIRTSDSGSSWSERPIQPLMWHWRPGGRAPMSPWSSGRRPSGRA